MYFKETPPTEDLIETSILEAGHQNEVENGEKTGIKQEFAIIESQKKDIHLKEEEKLENEIKKPMEKREEVDQKANNFNFLQMVNEYQKYQYQNWMFATMNQNFLQNYHYNQMPFQLNPHVNYPNQFQKYPF